MSRHTLRNVACQALFRHLRWDPQVRIGHPDDLSQVHLASFCVRDQVRAVGAAGGLEAQALRRSRGGYGPQRHVLVDAAGQLLRVRLTHGAGRQHAPDPATAAGTVPRPRAGGPGLRCRPPAALHRRAGGQIGDSGLLPLQGACRSGTTENGTASATSWNAAPAGSSRVATWPCASRRRSPATWASRCSPLAVKPQCCLWPHALHSYAALHTTRTTHGSSESTTIPSSNHISIWETKACLLSTH